MTPSNLRSVPMDVAELAVAHSEMRGDFNLLQSELRQGVQTLTSMVHDVQGEQERAREERTAQSLTLQSVNDRLNGLNRLDGVQDVAAGKVRGLELAVSEWKGIVKGALWAGGGAVALALGFVLWRLDSLEDRVQRVEVRQQTEVTR